MVTIFDDADGTRGLLFTLIMDRPLREKLAISLTPPLHLLASSSDAAVVASMAAAADYIDHVKGQVQDALLAAAVSTVGFSC
jgi:hypothetical protein